MKLAVVSMTFNDGFKIKEWRGNYDGFKNDADYFVIVDNGSEKEYVDSVKNTFPEAVVIERADNGGCTAAYNDGIQYALKNTDADAIAIVANDMRLTEGCLPAMYEYLMSDKKLGIVSTAILNRDSEVIDNYGHTVKGFTVVNGNQGERISSISVMRKYTALVSGGFTMAKREFYESAGLQDEKLFMYCDELDTAFKAQKAGFKIGVIANRYAWHWHVNNPAVGRHSSASRYLISRNRVYLAKKYSDFFNVLKQAVRGLFLTPMIYLLRFVRYRKAAELKDGFYSFVGAIHGIAGKMGQNSYTEF